MKIKVKQKIKIYDKIIIIVIKILVKYFLKTIEADEVGDKILFT